MPTHRRPSSLRPAATLLPLLALLFALPLHAQAVQPAPAAVQPAATATLTATLDSLFASVYPPDEPGCAVLVKKGDQILLRKGYGLANVELGVPISPEMVFRLGSITKQFTAAGILSLAADGKLALDDPLSKFLPDYPGPGASVTLHQLLNHTGGIPSYTSLPGFWDSAGHDLDHDQMLAFWKELPLDFEPGTDWSYSNSGFFLLGLVIEKVSGMKYAEFLEQRFFTPLGLEHTSYDDPRTIVPGRAAGYEGAPGAYANATYLSMTQPYSAGALMSNVDDLATWSEALLLSEKVLPAEWRERMTTPGRLADGRRIAYAYGIGEGDYAGYRFIAHGGGINGFATHALTVPEEELFVAVLSNNTGRPPGPGRLANRAAAIALGHPLDAQPEAELAAETLAEYVGVYDVEGDDDDRLIRLEEGKLYAQRAGGGKTEMRFSQKDRFHFADSFTEGRFERDAEGRVVGLWIEPQSGAEERSVKTDRPLPKRVEIEIAEPSILDAYLGRYELAPGFVLEVTRDSDALFAQATGQPKFPIFPESETRWFYKVVDAVIEFVGAEDGEADSVVLYQGGAEVPGKRVE